MKQALDAWLVKGSYAREDSVLFSNSQRHWTISFGRRYQPYTETAERDNEHLDKTLVPAGRVGSKSSHSYIFTVSTRHYASTMLVSSEPP
jgi:hypothetical protein